MIIFGLDFTTKRMQNLLPVVTLLTIIGRLATVSCNSKLVPPVVINTWNFTTANARAWQELEAGHSALDAIEHGCGQCEIDRCDGTVGWGGSPSESGETYLDAMIMDGETYDVGAVGGLRRIKGAIAVARLVLERTNHTLLVGDMATEFAVKFGFKEESLTSVESKTIYQNWLLNSCQPNYWRNVSPNPRTSCGPYHIEPLFKSSSNQNLASVYAIDSDGVPSDKPNPIVGHDTVGMVAMDSLGRIASGTSTNGARHKVQGRVGDSPIPGAGSYAAKEAGAAAATGDGDFIMRFLLSYQAVENLRRGMSAAGAALDVMQRLTFRTGRPFPQAAVVVLAKDGHYGAACCGLEKFPFVISDANHQLQTNVIDCSL